MVKKVLILPGDNMGPEIVAEAVKVLKRVDEKFELGISLDYAHLGGAGLDAEGSPCPQQTFEKARESDAILLGAVGGPQWDNVERHLRPEKGLLTIRSELDLFGNLRPAIMYPQLAHASSLKPEFVSGLDILIVRELVGGIYFGEPRGIEDLGSGNRRGINTQVYETWEIRRIAEVAFELAKKRNNKVTSSEKRNVMESGLLWNEEVTKIHKEKYSDVDLDHMLADNCGMQLVRWPKQFDVIVTDNLFGDMLSDVAAMLTGSLGMLPSASLGKSNNGIFRNALYEPVHGSAPDIEGQGIANPLASILSFAMALKYSFSKEEDADILEKAISNVLDAGLRTKDIATKGSKVISTVEMGDAVISSLNDLS